jgi:hypothetical protein
VVSGASSVVGAAVSTGASVVGADVAMAGEVSAVSGEAGVEVSSLPQAAIARAETSVRATRGERTAAT